MRSNTKHRSVILWLLATAALTWVMILLGGVTRLTQSGLSIVEWKPITGIIPPLSSADWSAAFEAYQQFPEYQMVNQNMTLSEFKFIYLMEYSHRLLGRLLALVFFIPLVVLWARQKIPDFIKKKCLLILALCFLQGAVGWYMVKSGLVNVPNVSHYRLALHMGLAFCMLGLTIWVLLDYTKGKRSRTRGIPKILFVSFFLQVLTMIYGAFVAGLKAGILYNTFPLMEGQWLPAEWAFHQPLWINFFENPATVQWLHRVLAFLSLTAIWSSYFIHKNSLHSRSVLMWALAVTAQVALGALTIVFDVPLSLGVLHQVWAAIVMILGLLSLHRAL